MLRNVNQATVETQIGIAFNALTRAIAAANMDVRLDGCVHDLTLLRGELADMQEHLLKRRYPSQGLRQLTIT